MKAVSLSEAEVALFLLPDDANWAHKKTFTHREFNLA